MQTVYFITHPEVVIEPALPVPQWPLSAQGRARICLLLQQPWVAHLTAVYCTTEQKALDGASLLASHLGLDARPVVALGENDRSATGYLPAAEFEAGVQPFFAYPSVSVCGGEAAAVAQQRIVQTVTPLLAQETSPGAIAMVAHGGVGTLLLCALAGLPIDRQYEPPGSGGGHYFTFDAHSKALLHGWCAIDAFKS